MIRRYNDQKNNTWLFTPLSELLEEEEEETQWLVEGLLPMSGFSVLVGKPKSGKSTLIRNLAVAIAHGKNFLDKPTVQGKVLYLALEEKRSEIKKHFQELGAEKDTDILVTCRKPSMNAVKQLHEYAKEVKPALIIIDPLFKVIEVDDGNDYMKVLRALEPLLDLARETGAHICNVHHTNKGDRQGGESILGSTAIFATADSALLLRRSKSEQFLRSIQRYGRDLEETKLLFDENTRAISLGKTKQLLTENKVEEEICAYLRDCELPATEEEITDHVKRATQIIRTAVRMLIARQILKRTGSGRKGSPFLYSLK